MENQESTNNKKSSNKRSNKKSNKRSNNRSNNRSNKTSNKKSRNSQKYSKKNINKEGNLNNREMNDEIGDENKYASKEKESNYNFVKRSDINFPNWVNDKFKDYKLQTPNIKEQPCLKDGLPIWRGDWDSDNKNIRQRDTSVEIELTGIQRFLQEYFRVMTVDEKSLYRGLLLYHGLCSGKNCAAVAMSKNLVQDRQVVILCPASLIENYKSDLKKCGPMEYHIPKNTPKDMMDEEHKKIDRLIQKKYFFISYDSPVTLKKLDELPDGLNDKLLIVDEVHNLASMISGGGKKGMPIFEKIMMARNLKAIFLSGTPIINDPFEIAIIFNMLTGYIYPDKQKKGESVVENAGETIKNPEQYFSKIGRRKYMLFNDSETFYKYFIDDRNRNDIKILNPNMFKRRIQGLVSFYKMEQP